MSLFTLYPSVWYFKMQKHFYLILFLSGNWKLLVYDKMYVYYLKNELYLISFLGYFGLKGSHDNISVAESIRVTHLEPPNQLQIPSTKIKLQLFPLNESIRLVIEKVWKIASIPPVFSKNRNWWENFLVLLVLLQDGKNPFLELTLSARKKISSVVRHLNAKWGSSIEVMGQLMLFPYNTKLEELASCRRWTSNDSTITAREVYVDLGSPSIFRLRSVTCVS